VVNYSPTKKKTFTEYINEYWYCEGWLWVHLLLV
jgi:hypothetical protein